MNYGCFRLRMERDFFSLKRQRHHAHDKRNVNDLSKDKRAKYMRWQEVIDLCSTNRCELKREILNYFKGVEALSTIQERGRVRQNNE